ncbi:hypothetical protein [Limnohabitans sp.]|uniref:hypothetical protein n=1 Tax=Limnohabitans sp. TaxID=1907725 RepID=UPI00286F7E9D|nr:hypothetical protein [Limnohabitans sp.]
MKQGLFSAALAFFSTGIVFANPVCLQCRLSTRIVEVDLSVNESTGKVTQTYEGSNAGFTADAQFSPTHIVWQRKANTLQQVEKYAIDRRSLAIVQDTYLDGNQTPTASGSGSCKVLPKVPAKI